MHFEIKRLVADLTIHECSGTTYKRIAGDKDSNNPWVHLGGTVVALAKTEDESRVVYLEFAARQTWVVEDTRWDARGIRIDRQSFEGSLVEMCSRFEASTGHALPEITLNVCGQGIKKVSSTGEHWAPVNPWEMTPGASYSLEQPEGPAQDYEVDAIGERVVVYRAEEGERFGDPMDPRIAFSGEQWHQIGRLHQLRVDEVARGAQARPVPG